ncbi:MAG: hypothetical protein JNM72_26440 [Deltaproteobacteria bacterium]|nr:hypothetical protein [Deltaproteobacteria bacterium]
MNARTIIDVAPPADAPAIRVRLTVPRFSGPTRFVVSAVLGLHDIAALFAKGRVGAVNSDQLHDSFDVDLEPDTGVGGETNAGPIELMNDRGMLRLSLPASWGGMLTRYAERTDTVTIKGKAVARGWFRATPGAQVQIPLPAFTPARHIAVGIAP